jgi:hypothetical protein
MKLQIIYTIDVEDNVLAVKIAQELEKEKKGQLPFDWVFCGRKFPAKLESIHLNINSKHGVGAGIHSVKSYLKKIKGGSMRTTKETE